ncbi:CTLH/CRA C-terminal to lish motif domain-containing protein [Pseudomassariella vexata]|uniref:CTLH/CRA C-terminal to lish motif domain-domain-containing protein n=1 Tax=Pseudomassariella vexata TaxID=1141098 RepID=A0A1Y2EER1_9PEZI|nr:CTLH/CRA C-terminal to lish motif domain-containing protein [Pseudomassariella vexata]ORY70073.1 CTLH/CRA C-terminal to lish motif domain-domain-containing protein [Pseudomassariella vexata]
MGDHEASKLDYENHLLLEQPFLRLPFELLRKNFHGARYEVERDGTWIKNTLKDTATSAVNGRSSQEDVLKSLDSMISRMRGVKRKLTSFADEEARLYRHEAARVSHLGELYGMHSVDDVKYEAWSRTRLNRLLVDYLLRSGFNDSARMLAQERGIEDLVDVETFEQMSRVRGSLLKGSVAEALAWCTAGDTKKELRKMDSNLEFMLRYQQYIELVRPYTPAKLTEAIKHAQRFLHPYRETHGREVQQACGLLAVPPDRAYKYPAYRELYSPKRWEILADIFTTTHNTLLSLPSIPLLHMALSSGLSALKTPACHSAHPASAAAPSHSTSLALAATVCPICSTELNELARNVPYAHHNQSHVEHDLLLLPTGRAYGKASLDAYAKKSGLQEGQVKDLRTGDVFEPHELKKVFIT